MPASVRTFGVIVGLTGTSLVAFGSVASAAPAPVTVTMAEPFQGGAILVERTAGETTGQPDRWRMNQDIWLQNTGAATLVLDEITISYSGGSDPADITVAAASVRRDRRRSDEPQPDPRGRDQPASVCPRSACTRSRSPTR